jgi:tetratricopeptide (TPR) repeat protein
MENIAGLCYLEQKNSDYSSAIQCFKTAIDLFPKGEKSALLDIYEKNLAYAYSGNANHIAAINLFRKHLSDSSPVSDVQPLYISAYARSIYSEVSSNPTNIPSAEVKFVLEVAIREAKGYLSLEWIKVLSSKLNSMQSL